MQLLDRNPIRCFLKISIFECQMNRIDPYRYQKKILKAIQLLSAIVFFLFLLSIFFNWNWPFSSMIGAFIAPAIMYFSQRSEYMKCFIEIDADSIKWKLMQDEHAKKISLKTSKPEIESNWMGLIIYDGSEKHQISLDGVKNKDRKRILEKLKSFYHSNESAALC